MYIYIYIVIRGPQEHQSLTGSSIYALRPSAATYYHNRIYTYVVYGAVSVTQQLFTRLQSFLGIYEQKSDYSTSFLRCPTYYFPI